MTDTTVIGLDYGTSQIDGSAKKNAAYVLVARADLTVEVIDLDIHATSAAAETAAHDREACLADIYQLT